MIKAPALPDPPAGALSSPATARNRGPILEVLGAHLPARGRVLEIASGAGEHALSAALAFPGLTWQPTDPDASARDSIAAWRIAGGATNLAAPLAVDAADPDSWPAGPFEAVVSINMVHISPWAATEGLMAGAGRVLRPGGFLFLYGPYRETDVPLAESNAAFDASLRARDLAWGLRELDEVKALARSNDLAFTLRVPMPANNLSLLFRRV